MPLCTLIWRRIVITSNCNNAVMTNICCHTSRAAAHLMFQVGCRCQHIADARRNGTCDGGVAFNVVVHLKCPVSVWVCCSLRRHTALCCLCLHASRLFSVLDCQQLQPARRFRTSLRPSKRRPLHYMRLTARSQPCTLVRSSTYACHLACRLALCSWRLQRSISALTACVVQRYSRRARMHAWCGNA